MTKISKENMYFFYKKPISVNLGSRQDSISDKFGIERSTELGNNEYEELKEVYGEYDEESEEYILKDKNRHYEGFEVGILEFDGSGDISLVFNDKKADVIVNSDIVNNMLSNTLTIFFDYKNLSSVKHWDMFNDDEIYPKLFDFISNQFINLRSSRRYILKIEGVYDEQDSNMLKWELSRIASIDFKHNSWTNWNKVSYSGFIKYENKELIMLEN